MRSKFNFLARLHANLRTGNLINGNATTIEGGRSSDENERSVETGILFNLWKYLDENGDFDYKKYVLIQTTANKNKLDHVWVQQENVQAVSKYILRYVEKPTMGICHGTRRGLEQKWFSEALKCDVIGTEISETASDFPNTIQWDFHNTKDEWIDRFDFIYSNSFDHSYDPESCLNSWMKCLKRSGVCVIEHTSGHEKSKETDPFGASIYVMPFLIARWGKGIFSVREVVEAPAAPSFAGKSFPAWFLIIGHNPRSGA